MWLSPLGEELRELSQYILAIVLKVPPSQVFAQFLGQWVPDLKIVSGQGIEQEIQTFYWSITQGLSVYHLLASTVSF